MRKKSTFAKIDPPLVASWTSIGKSDIFDVRTVGFVVNFGSCKPIHGGFLLLAVLCIHLVSDTWPLPSPSVFPDSRSTVINRYGLWALAHLQLKCILYVPL